MRKYEALNYYLNNYDLISSEIMDAITGKNTKIKFCYDKNNPQELEKLKTLIKYLL